MYGDQFGEFACWYKWESKGYGDNVSFKKNPICIYLRKFSTPTKYSICKWKLILLYAPLAFILGDIKGKKHGSLEQ